MCTAYNIVLINHEKHQFYKRLTWYIIHWLEPNTVQIT